LIKVEIVSLLRKSRIALFFRMEYYSDEPLFL